VDTRSILGVQSLRPSFLDDVSAAEPRQAEAGDGARVVTTADIFRLDYVLDDDDVDDDEDEEDDGFDDDDEEDDDEEEDEDVETWQVSQSGRFP
jgi:hypothetical protein